MRTHIISALFSISVLAAMTGFSQTPLQGIVEKLQQNQEKDLQEKILVHLDRSFYSTGENIWFKIYVVDGYTHTPVDVSKVAYLEVIDRNQKPVLQTKIKLENGLGNGVVAIPVSLETDHYTVRAYTHWMKNFSPEFFFHQTISIVNLFQRQEDKAVTNQNTWDIQFFPEGGELVQGVKSKVAFRVVDASGKGVDFRGVILNDRADTLVRFNPLKFGIGTFFFTPDVGENYRAIIKTNKGLVLPAILPPIKKEGYSIFVRDTIQNRIKITLTSSVANQEQNTIYFIGHTRQIVKVATTLNLTNGRVTFMVNRNDLGEGISHFTVFNHRIEPVCERLYFNPPQNQNELELTTAEKELQSRSKVILQINSPQNLLANTSLSVYKRDSLYTGSHADFISYLWLSSELKGNIESPEYYFTDNKDVTQALDNLMLTHGWSRFKWDEVIHTANRPWKYLPEYRGHLIEGIVKGIHSSQPLQGIPVYLASPDKKIELHAAYSQREGRITMETTNLYGSKKIYIQTGFQDSARIEIESPFTGVYAQRKLLPLRFNENSKALLTERSISMQTEDFYHRGRVIENKTSFTDSSAFYGVAPERYLLDDYTRFPVMEEVLREYVKGVRVRKRDNNFVFKIINAPENDIFEKDPLVLLDGVPVFNINKIMEMDPLRIKGIDVTTNLFHYGNFEFEGIVSFKTYKHDLGGFQFEPGTLILDYEGLQTKKEFFSPRYETPSSQQSRLPDMRHLLLWMPELTLKESQQNIEFYTSDLSGTFQAVLQGITSDGKPIYETCTFKVIPINP